MKRKIPILLSALATLFCCVVAMVACSDRAEYRSGYDIPPINANTVLHIERNKLNLALGMTIDSTKVIADSECILVYDDGTEFAVTAAMLADGAVSYEKFDVATTGENKRIEISYKDIVNYITYDVRDYAVELYADEQLEKQWGERVNVAKSATLTKDLVLSVGINLSEYNYSTDTKTRNDPTANAQKFCGWYDDNETLQTGVMGFEVKGGAENIARLHAHYLTDDEYNNMQLTYDAQGRRVFSGYDGDAIQKLVIPEGVTYVDPAALFTGGDQPTQLNFTALSIPSTAALRVPLSHRVNSAGLTAIEVNEGSERYSSYGGALYSKDYKTLYFLPASATGVTFHKNLTTFDIYSCAFWQSKSLVIPDSVTTLNEYCFYNAAELQSVVWGANVKTIMKGAFMGTKVNAKYDRDIALYTEVPNRENKYSLSVILDKSITSYSLIEGTVGIDGSAFGGCKNLKTVDLGDELETISESAFSGCVELESIALPPSLRNMGFAVFYECKSLKTVTGYNANIAYINSKSETPYERTLPNYTFYGCESLASFTIPQGIEAISAYAFSGCSSLASIEIPNTVTSIGTSAFHGTGIKSLVLPASVEEIGQSAFAFSQLESVDISACVNLEELPQRCFEATNLKSFTFPDNIKTVPNYFMYNCATIESVDFNNVTTIGSYAFAYCPSLVNIAWGVAVTTINSSAFRYSGLRDVVLPDTVIAVGTYAFGSCYELQRITLGKSVASFGTYTFAANNSNDISGASPILYLTDALKTIDVHPENVNFKSIDGILYAKKVGNRNYDDFVVLYSVPNAYERTTLTLPEQVKVIVPYAVHDQANVTNVVLNDGLEIIGKAAFYDSKKITTVNIPASVVHIGANVFMGCTSLEAAILDENNEAYTADGNAMYKGDTLMMYIGSGTSYTVKSGATAIDTGVFMRNNNLQSIVLPDSVTSIGDKAFNDCANLKSITIGRGLQTIGANAFAGLSMLESITVDPQNEYYKAVDNILYSKDGTKLLLCAARNGMTDLTAIPNTVTEIGDYAFSYNATLSSVRLPAGITKVGANAFYECRAMTEFYANEGLRSLGAEALAFKTTINPDDKTEMRYCNTLKTVLLYAGVALGDSAFRGHYGIEKVFLKMSLEEYSTMLKDAKGNPIVNVVYLIYGCPTPDGKYYNNIEQYFYREFTPDYEIDGAKWFRFNSAGEPVSW